MYGNATLVHSFFQSSRDKPQHIMYGNFIVFYKYFFFLFLINLNI